MKHLPYICLALLLITACSGGIKTEASYPTRPSGTDKIIYSDQKAETIWGEEGSLGKKLFGDKEEDKGGGALGVNAYLWRAALDTISFMPVASADPFGGVIITDWYENPDVKGERYKLNVYILDKQMRADGVKVSVFKQKMENKGWRDIKTSDDMATSIENAILTRAREMRITQLGTINK